jgi:hypothetical protein
MIEKAAPPSTVDRALNFTSSRTLQANHLFSVTRAIAAKPIPVAIPPP